jgi:diketogulonate reductase-like aldo/keto reductase
MRWSAILKRKFGWTGVEVPVIGMGTWMLEGNRNTERLAVEALRIRLDLGLTHIGTAEMYGDGHVEELVAEAIAGRRDEVFLVRKVLPSSASYEGTLKACERSLKRLKSDWLDLYLLHWPGSFQLKRPCALWSNLLPMAWSSLSESAISMWKD